MAATVAYSAALSENRNLESKHVSGHVTECGVPFSPFSPSCFRTFKNLSGRRATSGGGGGEKVRRGRTPDQGQSPNPTRVLSGGPT